MSSGVGHLSSPATPGIPLAALLKAMADPTRLEILAIIGRSPSRETCVEELKPHFQMSQPAISQHIKVLVDAGIIVREKRGSWHWYRLDAGTVLLLRQHAERFLACTDTISDPQPI